MVLAHITGERIESVLASPCSVTLTYRGISKPPSSQPSYLPKWMKLCKVQTSPL